jgi:N-carbamoylputrescine amidase
MSTILTVAAAQIQCQDGKVDENLTHAALLVESAVQRGAQLVVFPEFMPQGYRLTQEIWDSAEPFDGPTTAWLRGTAKQHNLYVGTSFLESDGCDFFNTFALAGPDGEIAGVVRKRNPSLWEAYFFKGRPGSPAFDTEIGRIGVGICFDNHTFEVADAIARAGIDLMLMPHSYCTPTQPSKMASQADIDRLNSLPGRVARLYNEWFGVPVVLANKSGPWDSPVPNMILGKPSGYTFPGRSAVIDSDGLVRSELGCEEGVALAEVCLESQRKKTTRPPKYSRYVYPGPPGRELIRYIEAIGTLNYALSGVRKRKAAAVITTGDGSNRE